MPVYLDHAATTPVAPEVVEVMVACLAGDFGNPSSVHALGRRAAARVAEARAAVLAALGGAGELVFTSGGTEADALALLGATRARGGGELVATAVEHPAVLATAEALGRLRTVPVGPLGVVDPGAVAAAVGPETTVVACMLVQNELGTLQPVAEVARAVKARRPDVHVHCDAVQALGKVPIEALALGVDSLAISAHKLHGPKGVGALWLAPGARLAPLVTGGGQEHGRRGGTENVAGIAGFGVAARAALARLGATHRVAALRDEVVAAVRARLPAVHVLGEGAPGVAHIASFAAPGLGAPLVAALERHGVLVSAGSACHGGRRSPIADALGLPADAGTLRVSLAHTTTRADVAAFAAALARALGA